ncbi:MULTISPECIES: hypothetical protein [Lysinibacillus]|uniref:hypothetical protein n=1 Tax=Lysinibacillus TaxID=400634 RepID=UPI001CBFA44B|nr:hypothetical protein [Lysinibacillus sphaericus]
MESIIRETIDSYNNYIIRIPKGCRDIAIGLRSEKVNDTLKSILDFSEGVIWLTKVNHLLAVNGYINDLNIQRIDEYLEEINSGLLLEDYYMVADLFEYEIQSFFENCKPFVNSIRG